MLAPFYRFSEISKRANSLQDVSISFDEFDNNYFASFDCDPIYGRFDLVEPTVTPSPTGT